MKMINPGNLARALRLPFVTASVFPFILGSMIERRGFDSLSFILGLVSVIATHLSANLMNDYADSKSGLDWRDMRFYEFFGGSKLIQAGELSERFYFRLSVGLAVIAGLCVMLLSVRLKSFLIPGLFTAIFLLAWLYSAKPGQFSYRMTGEMVIFLLFGPALVMGGYFIQTGIFPGLKSFLLSLPFGFLTTAILFSNEVPDYPDDQRGGKFTWVSLTGQSKAFILYSLLMLLAFFSIGLSVALEYLNPVALVSFLFILPAAKSAKILKRDFDSKIKLVESSKLTIMVQALVSLILILGVLL